MTNKSLWRLSVIVSAVLLVVLVMLWGRMNEYWVDSRQLVNQAAVDDYLKTLPGVEESSLVKVKTGIFIQSLKFSNSSEVNLSGYIWQHYQDGIHDAIKPRAGEIGFIFPEQVDSGNDIAPREAYRKKIAGGEVIGWYFEASLRQPFKYDKYPFDHKTVWIRLWPKDFDSNVVLVPDFSSYQSTGENDIFGIEKDIVLGTWSRKNTYFDYRITSYDTNFGLPAYVGQQGFPELHYNFVLKRKFENAFILHLLPLFLVAALLFSALLTVSAEQDLASRHGFNTSGFIGACSGLFFVVLLAHIQLREQFAGTSIVYMEYFYLFMYALLMLSSANTYLFSMRVAPWLKVIHYRDNLIPKLIYWPVLLLSMILISGWVMAV